MNFLTLLGAVYGALIGSALASFACVIGYRGPRHESFFGGRSHCACGRQLRAYENVPVLGWVRVWGRARCCGARIPVKYVAAELGGAVAGATFGAQMVDWLTAGTPWQVIVFLCVAVPPGFVWLVATLTSDHPEPPTEPAA